ncbi:MAG: prepilin-type N-terminal cleavage/methylation domain-containing protein, partial [Candidatus Gracilibacteria bacterium]|nr:prepilin-type N-terminal cleavage/methylation domain-containing protein [Candidatus Gracilibacteria bacterium]
MKKQQIKAFTLVELIIVITILAILATIGFMSYQSYTTDARDANRITTVKEISNGLDITYTKKSAYPMPDGTVSMGTVAGTIYAYKGTVGDAISKTLRMQKRTDPMSKDEYTYGVNSDQTQYQIAAVLENNTVAQINTIANTTYADLGV